MNFARDVVAGADSSGAALVELTRAGSRREWTFGEIAQASERMAGALIEAGVERGDVVMTLIGNRSEWVVTMVACFHLGAVVLPCTEQLRAKDLALRLRAVSPRAVVADERNRTELEGALIEAPGAAVMLVPDPTLLTERGPVPYAELAANDPCLVTFTSGTSGEPKAVLHGQRYLFGQRLQAEHWLTPRGGDLVWCTAASGWSKSARNVFIAPWLMGATALLHDERFDPAERLEIVARERVDVLCMAPTEYRVISKRTALCPLPSLHALVAAGEALDATVLEQWHEATGLDIRDGYGQTETGQLTGNRAGMAARPGSMGQALPGIRLWVEDGELVLDPATVPTFFLGYHGEPRPTGSVYRTGDKVSMDADGYLYFEGRADDVIISSGYRIGPFEVESALVAHAAVADAAVVATPDPERGSVVHAYVVLREPADASDALARDLQTFVKGRTAPYKYPRMVTFVPALPKTSTGKIRRAALRSETAS